MGDLDYIDKRSILIRYWKTKRISLFFKPFFVSISLIYCLFIYLRKLIYRIRLLSVKRLECPVFSVGNITLGGSGKTPVVGMIANILSDNGFHPVILSRGYKRKSTDKMVIVSDGKDILISSKEAGDEPYMLARWLPHVPVLVGSGRYRSGIFAMNKFKADCFILDDGFQHLHLYRNLDILVINAGDPFGGERLFPWGGLREPLSGLARASLILINKSGLNQDIKSITEKIRKYNNHARIIETFYIPECLIDAAYNGMHFQLSYLTGKSVIAFSGIANPELFFKQLNNIGAKVEKAIIFDDHHWFSKKEMDYIKKTANDSKIDLILTTEKDSVRLSPDDSSGILVLKMKMGIKGNINILKEILVTTKNPDGIFRKSPGL